MKDQEERHDEICWKEILSAAKNGDLKQLEEALKYVNHADQICNEEGYNALHCAASEGHLHIIQYLHYAKKFDLNQVTRGGDNALHLAAFNQHSDIVEWMEERGISIYCSSDEEAYVPPGERELTVENWFHLSCFQYDSFLQAVQNNDVEQVTLCLQLCKDLVNKRDPEFSCTAAHLAADLGYLELLQILNGFKANMESRNLVNETPLHVAAYNNHTQIVRWLIEECQVDMNSISNQKWNILHIASSCGYTDLVEWILSTGRIGIDERTFDGDTYAHLAVYHGHQNVLEVLCTYHFNLSSVNKLTENLMHIACLASQPQILKWLHVKGISCTFVNHIKESPVVYAIKYGHLEVLDALDECGMDWLHENDDGDTYLHIATSYGQVDSVRWILDRGIDYSKTNNKGKTALQLAKIADLTGCEEVLKEYTDRKIAELGEKAEYISQLLLNNEELENKIRKETFGKSNTKVKQSSSKLESKTLVDSQEQPLQQQQQPPQQQPVQQPLQPPVQQPVQQPLQPTTHLQQNSPESTEFQELEHWVDSVKYYDIANKVPEKNSTMKQIGKLSLHHKINIFNDDNTVVVYKGFHEEWGNVSVRAQDKSILEMKRHTIFQEISKYRPHPHILRYYTQEEDEDTLYVVTEDYTHSIYDDSPTTADGHSTIITQLFLAMDHLHQCHIVHGNLTPDNILWNEEKVVKLAGLEYARKIKPTLQPMTLETANIPDEKDDDALGIPDSLGIREDIFLLGTFIFHLVNREKQSYTTCLLNMRKGEPMLGQLLDSPELLDLIEKMIDPHSVCPSIQRLLKHPYFWNSFEKLSYIEIVSNKIEEFREMVDKVKLNQVIHDWRKHIHPEILHSLRRWRAYSSSISDLLRLIRNLNQHFSQQTDEVLLLLAGNETKYAVEARKSSSQQRDVVLNYFLQRFPSLVISLWKHIGSHI